MGAVTMGRLRCFLLAAAAFSADAASAEPDLALLRKAGSYVLLLDADKRPIAGSYWLSEGLKVSTHSRNPGSYPQPLLYTDRDFPPGRIANMYLFLNGKETVTPDIRAVPVGETVTVTRKHEPMGLLAGKVEARNLTYKLTTVAVVSEVIGGAKLLSRIYEIAPVDPANKEMDWGRRVYIETVDLDISREQAARVADIETGKAGSTGDFEGIYASRLLSSDDYTKCMTEKRAGKEYRDAVRREKETNDAWMAKEYLATGVPWWEATDAKVRMEALLDVTGLCLPGSTK